MRGDKIQTLIFENLKSHCCAAPERKKNSYCKKMAALTTYVNLVQFFSNKSCIVIYKCKINVSCAVGLGLNRHPSHRSVRRP